MTEGKLLPVGKLRRVLRQHMSFKDPISKKRVEILFSTVYEGKNEGCPVIEINDRFVTWDLADLAFEAVRIFRQKGVLPRKAETPKEEVVKGADDEDFTGFSSVSGEKPKDDEEGE